MPPLHEWRCFQRGKGLPPLSCGAVRSAVAITVDGSHSALGQVLLLGGKNQDYRETSAVRLVDLTIGICTPQADLLLARSHFAAARLPNRGMVWSGGWDGLSTEKIWERQVLGALDAAWTWRVLPGMSVGRTGCSGCVLSDGRFAVLGGWCNGAYTPSCETLPLGDDEHWSPPLPMHDSRCDFTCVAVAGCIIVAGGSPLRKAFEVYDEALGRWLRLPHDLPVDVRLYNMDSALV
jgi:hypothetical protein